MKGCQAPVSGLATSGYIGLTQFVTLRETSNLQRPNLLPSLLFFRKPQPPLLKTDPTLVTKYQVVEDLVAVDIDNTAQSPARDAVYTSLIAHYPCPDEK